jgi:hypothetical protein
MKRTNILFGMAFVFGLALLATAGRQQGTPQSTQKTQPTVTVGAALKAKAKSPTPGPTAKQQSKKTSIGKGEVAVTASQASSFWTEQLDVDDDGVVETSDFLYDAQRGVLYSYREDDFACQNGQTANGGILQALYASGNKAGNPAGSGWYAMALDTGKCAAKRSGIYGCRFDAHGNATDCGAATINNTTGDITVAEIQ